MVVKETSIQNASGFHIRPAQLFVEKASQFTSEIRIITEGGDEVEGKSILGLMTLGFELGSKFKITAEGQDEEEAVNELIDLVNNKFGEE